MIYYFSGTGNSQWIAEQLAKQTKDTAVSIAKIIKDTENDITAGDDETVGVVFPVYAWAPPLVVMEFLAHVHVSPKTFTYAVCTCGDEAGNTMQELQRVFPFKSAYSITMPNNFIPMFDLDLPELVREKIGVAIQKLPRIAAEITMKRSVIDVKNGPAPGFKTAIINPLFTLFLMNPARFSADKTCTGCGICTQSCPFGTIQLVNGRPVWKGRCQQCMSCISRCPVHAIQCGSGTRYRGRYLCPELTADITPAAAAQATVTQTAAQVQPSARPADAVQKTEPVPPVYAAAAQPAGTCCIRSIDHIELSTVHPAALVNFYHRLGFEMKDSGSRVELYAGTFKILVHVKGEEPEPHALTVHGGSASMCFEITGDLAAFKQRLTVSGITPVSEIAERQGKDGSMRSFYVRDPDGNLIELCSYR